MVLLADKNGCVDSAFHTLVKHIPTDIPIVMVSWCENFVFNDALLNVKDYILVCYCEYGYDFEIKESHIWGSGRPSPQRYSGVEWDKFDQWVKNNSPKVFFKRELLDKDRRGNVYAIDYPAPNIEPAPIQSEEEFNSRPLSACYYFGRSHEARLLAHASIWEGATKYGYSVCDNLFYFNGFMQHEAGKKYFSAHIPHYQRHPIELLLSINGMAKIGIAPKGAGTKTFRSAESCYNAVMLMWHDDLAWGIDWIHGFNCLKCAPGKEVETIEYWAEDTKTLYKIYLEGVKTWEKYRVQNYINNYILPIINKA